MSGSSTGSNSPEAGRRRQQEQEEEKQQPQYQNPWPSHEVVITPSFGAVSASSSSFSFPSSLPPSLSGMAAAGRSPGFPPTAILGTTPSPSQSPMRFPMHQRHSSLNIPTPLRMHSPQPSRKGSGESLGTQTNQYSATGSTSNSTESSSAPSPAPSPRHLSSGGHVPPPVSVPVAGHASGSRIPRHMRHDSSGSLTPNSLIAPPAFFPLPFPALPIPSSPSPSPSPVSPSSSRLLRSDSNGSAGTPAAGSSPERLAHRSLSIRDGLLRNSSSGSLAATAAAVTTGRNMMQQPQPVRKTSISSGPSDEESGCATPSPSLPPAYTVRDRENGRRVRNPPPRIIGGNRPPRRSLHMSGDMSDANVLAEINGWRHMWPFAASADRNKRARLKEAEKRLGMRSWTRFSRAATLVFVVLGLLLLCAILPASRSYCAYRRQQQGNNIMFCRAVEATIGVPSGVPLMAARQRSAGGVSSSSRPATPALPVVRPAPLPVEDPLIPGTTPFSILALLRDMPSDDEMQSALKEQQSSSQLLQHRQAMQWNALRSWMKVVPARHLLLFMDSDGACESLLARDKAMLQGAQCFAAPCWADAAESAHRDDDDVAAAGAGAVDHEHDHSHSHGRPLLDCVFHKAHVHTRTDMIAYVAADVILDPLLAHTVHRGLTLLQQTKETSSSSSSSSSSSPEEEEGEEHAAAAAVAEGSDAFLLVSRRTNTLLPSALLRGSDPSALERVVERVQAGHHQGALQSVSSSGSNAAGEAIDLFVYPRAAMGLLRFDPRDRLGNPEFAELYPPSYNLSRALEGRVDLVRSEGETPETPDSASSVPATEALYFPPFLAVESDSSWSQWLLSEMVAHAHVDVVDITRFGMAIHQEGEEEHAAAAAAAAAAAVRASAASWNSQLGSALTGDDSFKIQGRIDNANYLLQGVCPDCVLVTNEARAIDALLQARATVAPSAADGVAGTLVMGPTEDGAAAADLQHGEQGQGRPIGRWVALVSVSSRDESLLHNWRCWAQYNELEHVVLLAQDRRIARVLASRHQGAAFVLFPGAPEVVSGITENLAFIQWRVRFMRDAIAKSGVSVVSTSVRSIWLRGALQLFHHLTYGPLGDSLASVDVLSRAHNPSMTQQSFDRLESGQSLPSKLDARVLVLKSTPGAQQIWTHVEHCVEMAAYKMRFSTQLSDAAKADMVDNGGFDLVDRCLTDQVDAMRSPSASASASAAAPPAARWHLLDPLSFPTASSYFDSKAPQSHGVVPWIIDLSTLRNPLDHWHQLRDWGLMATLVPRDFSSMGSSEDDEDTDGLDAAGANEETTISSSLAHGASPSLSVESVKNLQCHPLADPPHVPPAYVGDAAAVGSGAAAPPAEQDVFVTVRVLTFNRVSALRRLLDSLLASEYGGHKVGLEISVDRPTNEDFSNDPKLVLDWQATKRLCTDFEWPFGPVKCLISPVHLGLTGQWTSWTYPPAEDMTPRTPLVVVLEDDISVSPAWYSWMARALRQYYFDPAQFDTRMAGLSLQHQHTVLGESLQRAYSASQAPWIQLGGNITAAVPTLYRYQLVGTWGALFFPQHWREFKQWLAEKQFVADTGLSTLRAALERDEEQEDGSVVDGGSSDAASASVAAAEVVELDGPGSAGSTFTPCVPLLLSNVWWQSNPHKVWSQWMVRFAFERGYYTLYTNFPDNQALVTNHRDSGLNFKDNRGATNPLMIDHADDHTSINYKLLRHFPSLHSLPVFDLHFRRLHTTRSSSWLSLALHLQGPPPPHGIDPCLTLKRTKANDAAMVQQALLAAKAIKEGGAAAAAVPAAGRRLSGEKPVSSLNSVA